MSEAKKTRLFVISDLHLGGAPASDGKPAFQMCTERGRSELCRFIAYAAGQGAADRDVHLVIAGDIVDFLAEERAGGFRPFTADDALAEAKLAAIIADTADVWEALRRFVASGAALTLLLGNHDLELSLPAPRRLLRQTLGPGRVDFVYDNQAFSLGRVLVEHGNRYDDWNAVPHDDLREVRSRLSRGEPAEFDPVPGSRMVVELVNPTKAELAFVDLLKPEDAALLPFLALLAPNRFQQVSTTLKNRIRALRVRYGADQQPKDRNFVGNERAEAAAVGGPSGTGDGGDDVLFTLAEQLAAGGDAALVSASGSFLTRWRAKLADAYREKQLDLLLRALQAFPGAHRDAFDVGKEQAKYLKAATETVVRGFDVVVYGHTHLAKRISLAGRKSASGVAAGSSALYLNSGTWADLMTVPPEILVNDDSAAARVRLRSFADDLASNRIERWRSLLPTFVRVEVGAKGEVEEAALELLAADGRPLAVTSELVRERLIGAVA